jgi:uncharacterized membrane protein
VSWYWWIIGPIITVVAVLFIIAVTTALNEIFEPADRRREIRRLQDEAELRRLRKEAAEDQ